MQLVAVHIVSTELKRDKNEQHIERLIYIIPVYIMPGIVGSNLNFSFSFMTALDSFIAKVGQDKFDHHLVGALICFCVSTVSILQEGSFSWDALFGVIIGTVVALFFAIVKDLIIDEKQTGVISLRP